MTQEEKRKGPVYTGLRRYVSGGGYAIWYPMGWREIPMTGEHKGIILAPYPDHVNTCIAAEKIILPLEVKKEDALTLKKGFEVGIKALEGAEIEMIEDSITNNLVLLDARYTFLENGVRRKRWTRNLYWNEAQLVLLAQGQTVEDYDYWLPVFYNSLMTTEVASPY